MEGNFRQNAMSCIYSYSACFFILHYIFTCVPLYCFRIHAYYISLWMFFFIFYAVQYSLLYYSLLIRVNPFSFVYIHNSSLLQYNYTYLYNKRDFDHAYHEGHSTKTNSNCVNLMTHYNARRWFVPYSFYSPLRKNGMFCSERRFATGTFCSGIYVRESR